MSSRYGGGGYGGYGGGGAYSNGASGDSNPYGDSGYGGSAGEDRYGGGGGGGSVNPYGASGYGDDRGGSAPNPYGDDRSNTPGSYRDPYGGPPAPLPPQAESRSLRSQPSREGGFQPRNRRQGGFGGGGAIGATPMASEFERPPPQRNEIPEDDMPSSQVNRPTSLERSKAKRRSGGAGYGGSGYGQRSPQRKANGTGPGTQQIEDVLKYIQRDWDFMSDEKCVPVEVALKLMDDSSLGLARRHGQFQDIHMQLQTALRAIVNEHHQGFNSSIGTFHSIQAAIQTSQTRLRTLRENLVTAKGSLSTTKPELKGLATKSQEFDDMLQVLNSIDHLQSIPEKLEARISEKRFLSAVELLQDGLKTIRNSQMDEIGSLSDLRVYLSNQEHSLVDIMVEELHNHLYLKSPYCENRWKTYAPSHLKAGLTNGQKNGAVQGRKLYQFLDKLDTSRVMHDDPARNPEADSFLYIQLIIESLNSLGRMDIVVDTITQRLPVELFKVVEKSTNEADQRHPSSLRGIKSGLDALDGNNTARSIVLNDLLGMLFARFEAIAEGHRVVHEVIGGILKREGMRSSSALTGGFRELWKLYQSEIRSILHDYLAADGNLALRGGEGAARPGSVFSRIQRDKTKQIFKLNDMDAKSSDMSTERDDLEAILKTSVPGLVSDSKRPSILSGQNNSNGASDGSATGHKLLVEPSVFNMGILLPPSLTFLNRLKEVVPPTSDIALSTLTSFLDDFLVNVFLPQLEETLTELCAQTFIENDAFQQDPQWALYSKKPIFKGTRKFFQLVSAFCRMLDALPHDQAFSHLIISQIMTYYDKCHGWFKALVARPKPHPVSRKLVRLAAELTEEESEVKDTVVALSQLGESQEDEEQREKLLKMQADMLIKSGVAIQIEEADILTDKRSITALCMLHTSMKWLASKTALLRHISTEAVDSTRRESRQGTSRRWTLVTGQRGPVDSEKVYLPLNEETAGQFDAAVGLYRQLAQTAARMLQLEIRVHVLHYVKKAMTRTFILDNEMQEPDPEVVKLNADIVTFDEVLGSCLQESVQKFIITGLSQLLDTLLLTLSFSLSAMNANGCSRLRLNILVLQQNLKNIETNASLSRSSLYFALFAMGPEEIIKKVKSEGKKIGFSGEEVSALLKLVYSEGVRSERREVSVAAERGLARDELLVSEYLW